LKSGIVAFPFGAPSTIRSNRRIAEIAAQKSRELEAPIFTNCDVPLPADVEQQRSLGGLSTTLRFAVDTVCWVRRNGIEEIWVVAAKPHLWRCVRDLSLVIKTIQTEIKVQVCKEIEQYPNREWFCSDSTQERTSSRYNWQKRELIFRLMPVNLYWRLAI